MTLIGVPIKAFGVAKARLAPVLGPAERSRLGRRVGAHTLAVAAAVGDAVVVTGDEAVAGWAGELGYRTIAECPDGLDGAGRAVVEVATGRWAVLHADLPLLTVSELAAALDAGERAGAAIAPSSDGGTSLVVAEGEFDFAYGPGSFHRHLSRVPDAAVVVRRGLAVDLDTPADLAAVGNQRPIDAVP